MSDRHALAGSASGSAAPRYVAHLARDANSLETACGEPWQGWQAPANLDLQPAWMPNRATLPPHDQPRAHVDAIRQCQACQRVALRPPMSDPDRLAADAKEAPPPK